MTATPVPIPSDADERAWADLLAALLRREDLGPADTAWAMGKVMDGEATAVELAGFLVALRAKGETAQEVQGLVTAMLDRAALADLSAVVGPTVDTCGTGGDRANTVNISTMAAVVVAATGAPVVKHGNRAASSAAGSADVLEALGIAVDLPPAAVGECVSEAGIVFCFAPLFHPGMRHAAVARRELGVGTVFNVLGPLANPARPAAQVVGCADQRLAPVMAQALLARGTRALVVRGTDGLDELSTQAPTQVWDATGSVLVEEIVDAVDLGIARSEPGALRADDDVAAERDLEAAAERIATDGGDGRLRQRFELVEDASAGELVGVEGSGAIVAIFADVRAGNECLLPGTGEDHHPQGSVGGDGIELGLEPGDHFARQRIEFFGPVEDQPHHAGLRRLAHDESFGHLGHRATPSPRRR